MVCTLSLQHSAFCVVKLCVMHVQFAPRLLFSAGFYMAYVPLKIKLTKINRNVFRVLLLSEFHFYYFVCY